MGNRPGKAKEADKAEGKTAPAVATREVDKALSLTEPESKTTPTVTTGTAALVSNSTESVTTTTSSVVAPANTHDPSVSVTSSSAIIPHSTIASTPSSVVGSSIAVLDQPKLQIVANIAIDASQLFQQFVQTPDPSSRRFPNAVTKCTVPLEVNGLSSIALNIQLICAPPGPVFKDKSLVRDRLRHHKQLSAADTRYRIKQTQIRQAWEAERVEEIKPVEEKESSLAVPNLQGKLYRGRETKEWGYYRDNWTNGFGFGVSGGGSRACTSAWGVLNSLHSGGHSKFLTFAFMSSNSGGGWCLQPLLYTAPPPPNGQNNNDTGQNYSVTEMLGVYRASSFLSLSDLLDDISQNKALVGYGTTMINQGSVVDWWDALDSYFSIPRNIGQDYITFQSANWQICTFGQSNAEILEEIKINNPTEVKLADCFKVCARTLREGFPLPIAVGCAYKYDEMFKYWIYPVEFTPSCSGVFRDGNANVPKDDLGNSQYPDYLVTNALFGVSSWESQRSVTISGPMAALPFSGADTITRYYRDGSLGVNEFMAVSSDAAAIETGGEAYVLSTVTAPADKGKTSDIGTYHFLDGGVVDNIGLMPLLQRRLRHISVFISNAVEYFCPTTTLQDISDVSRYFGVSTDYFNAANSAVKEVGTMPQIAACFGSTDADVQPLLRRLQTNYEEYGAAVTTMRHKLQPTQVCKDFYGFSGHLYDTYEPVVTWYVVQRPQDSALKAPTVRNAPFWASLDPVVLAQYVTLMQTATFPYYDTEKMLTLTALEANAMKYYTSSMGDYYVMPHVRKNKTPSHFWIDDTRNKFASKDYFQIEDVSCSWVVSDADSSPDYSPLLLTDSLVSVIYSPLLQAPVIVYSTGIECEGKSQPSLNNTQLTCAVHTVCGIFVGGTMTTEQRQTVAFLGVYLYTKSEDAYGVINFGIGDFVSILPSGPIKAPPGMTQLRGITGLFTKAPVANEGGTFPQIAVLGEALSSGVYLCWKIVISPGSHDLPVTLSFANDSIVSRSPSMLNANKMSLISNDMEIVWLKDLTKISAGTVQLVEGGTNILQASVLFVFDVAYCPLLNGILIFCMLKPSETSPLAAQALQVQVSRYDNNQKQVVSNVVPVKTEEKSPIRVDSSSILHAEYQGNVFCVRVNSEVYTVYDLTKGADASLIVSKMQNIPFLPSFMS